MQVIRNVVQRWRAGACTVALIGLANCCQAEIVVVARAASPTAALSKEQVADVFWPRIRHWRRSICPTPIPCAMSFTPRSPANRPRKAKSVWARLAFTGKG